MAGHATTWTAKSVRELLGEDFEHLLKDAAERELVSGVVIGVLRGQESFLATTGTGATENSSYEIGSITKTFTLQLLHILIGQGKLRWDDRLQDFLPKRLTPSTSLNSDGAPITLGDLAIHRSGLPLLPENLRVSDGLNPFGSYSNTDLLDYLQQLDLVRRHDEPYKYSNLGYAALGFVMERASGRCYADLLKEELLIPLNLHDTHLALVGKDGPLILQGHTQGGKAAPRWRQEAFAPAGALCSTLPDMLHWCEFLSRRWSAGMAEGAFVSADGGDDGDSEWYRKTGMTGGFSTFIGIDTSLHRAVVLLGDRKSPGATRAIAHNAIRALNGDPLVPLRGNYGKLKAAILDTIRANRVTAYITGRLRVHKGPALAMRTLRKLLEAS